MRDWIFARCALEANFPVQHGPPVLLPNSLGFTPSINGRNGLKPDEVYDFSTKELVSYGTGSNAKNVNV